MGNRHKKNKNKPPKIKGIKWEDRSGTYYLFLVTSKGTKEDPFFVGVDSEDIFRAYEEAFEKYNLRIIDYKLISKLNSKNK